MYKNDDITYEQIFQYIDDFNSIKNAQLDDLRVASENEKIPIIKKDVENYIKNMLLILKPKKILEIGCAVGYSSIMMSITLSNNVKIDTLEIKKDMFDKAEENFRRFSTHNINIIFGDALKTIADLNDKYDLIFIDASKGHYEEFFNLSLDKVGKNSVIICDNVLYKGFLCLDETQIPSRQKTIYSRMTNFLKNIKNNKNISYNLLPLGDGLLTVYFK